LLLLLLAVALDDLEASLAGASAEQVAGLVVAYEPVWAIGTGKSADAGDAQQMCAALRARVSELFGGAAAAGVLLLYGGSVKPENARLTLSQADVDGALVGGASLVAEDFTAIVRAAIGVALGVNRRHHTSRSRH